MPITNPATDPIQHVVVLMLENRSFDHVLGSLQAVVPGLDGIDTTLQPPRYAGQVDGAVNAYDQQAFPGARDLPHDTREVLQQIAGGRDAFVATAAGMPNATANLVEECMKYFALGNLPAIHTLGQYFCVCDRWFASVPGPTWANRFFAHSGTSLGKVLMPGSSGYFNPHIHWYDQTTIYDRLSQANVDWRIYYHDFPQSLVLVDQFTSPSHLRRYDHIQAFFDAAQGDAGSFPAFSFIEPQYFGGSPNDCHPPHNIQFAQKLIADVYNALRANDPLFQSTLLVVVFDEHGGYFDHVTPPAADPKFRPLPAPGDTSGALDSSFSFDRLGVRVPAILISPYAPRGVATLDGNPPAADGSNRPVFDHTSILKYVIAKWRLGPLTSRLDQVNSIAEVLSGTARTTDLPFEIPGSLLADDVVAFAPSPDDLHGGQAALRAFADYLESDKAMDPVLAAQRQLQFASNGAVKGLDTFTGAAGPLTSHAPDLTVSGAPWQLGVSGSGTAGTVTLQGGVTGSGGNPTALVFSSLIETGVSDVTVGVDVRGGPNGGVLHSGLAVRATDGSNYILALVSGNAATLFRQQGGDFVTLAQDTSIAAAPNSVHRLQVMTSGSTVLLLWDGAPLLQVAEPFQQTATKHGLNWAPSYSNAATTYDNFAVSVAPSGSDAVSLLDTFTAPNGTLLTGHVPEVSVNGPAWQRYVSGSGTVGTLTLQNGAVGGGGDTTALVFSSVLETGASNVTVGVDVRGGASGAIHSGLAVRATDGSNYLLALVSGTSATLFRQQAGNFVTLAQNPTAVSAANGSVHRLEVRASGSAVALWWDGVSVLQVTEPFQQTATKHGLNWAPSYSNAAATYDNFSIIGQASSAPPPPPPPLVLKVLDTFTGARGVLLTSHIPDLTVNGAMWQRYVSGGGTVGTLTLRNGTVGGGGDTTALVFSTLLETGASDVTVGVDVRGGAGGAIHSGLAVRATDGSNYLLALVSGTNATLFRQQAGNFVQLAQAPISAAAGSVHRLEVEAAGSAVAVRWDGAPLLQVTEPFQQTATKHGLNWAPSYSSAASTYDNFAVSVAPSGSDAVGLLDTFTAPNGMLVTSHVPEVSVNGPAWQRYVSGSGTVGTLTLQNGAVGGGGDTTALVFSSLLETGASDVTVGVDVRGGAGGAIHSGLAVRATDGSNYLLALVSGTSATLFRQQAGTFVTLAQNTTAVSAVPGSVHRLEVRAIGTTVALWWDGGPVLQVTEPFQQTATKHGLNWAPSYSNATTTYDNFAVTDPAASPPPPPPPPSLPPTNYDADGKSDVAVYRPLDGTWYILTSQSNYTAQMSVAWGTSTDIPVPGDYDGDQKADVAYFRPSTGEWKILTSSSNFNPAASLTFTLGVRGDVPVPGDYDGDGRTDAAVFHAATATWTILKSTGGTINTVFGTWSSIPVPGDYDGDGATDLATFDPAATPSWSIQNSSGGQSSASLGVDGDIPVPGDYDGDGKTDVAVFHPAAAAQWQILKSSANNSSITIPWGTTGDVPIVGDYDGDGIIDAMVFRPSTGQWLMALSSSNYATGSSVTYGGATDVPLGRATQRTQPVIVSVSPNSEVIGNHVTLTGSRFGPAPGILTFNGAIAQPLTWSSTAITVPVPPGATTGPVVVTVNGVDSNTAAFTVLTTPGVTSTFCHAEWHDPMAPNQWWTHTWQGNDCTHGIPPAGWISIGQAQNTDNPIAAVANCQSAYGQVFNNPDFTDATGTSLNCMYVAPPSQPQPTPGITICSHTWNEFVLHVWTAHTWAASDCSHGLPEANDAWAGQSYYLPGMTDCSNGTPTYFNPYNWNDQQTTITVKCVYTRTASPAMPRFTLCTTGTLKNPDGSINYHSGWYNPYNNFQYSWKDSDCTNGLPLQGSSAIGIAVGSATNGGGGLQGGNCLPSGAQHYNDPYWTQYSSGQMRCLFENNATSPYIDTNPCGIGTFPRSVELPADGGRWYFLMNAFAGCGWTAVATVDWLIPDQTAGTGAGVLTFGVNPNMTVSSRTGGIQVCGTDPVLCGKFVVVQTPYWDGQPFDPGPIDTQPSTDPPPPVGTIVYYHTDAIGSVRMVTDAGGQVLARYDFWPFGEQWTGAPSSSGTNPRMFAGAERDSTTNSNFDYLGARYYAGLFGRFTTVDPNGGHLTNPQTLNRYVYAGNNPLRYTDPMGLDFYLECGDDSPTCHEHHVGKYNSSNGWEATVIKNADLNDPNSGASAWVDSRGVMVQTSGGLFHGSFTGDKTYLEGRGAFAGFSFLINGNCSGTCPASGTFSFPADRELTAAVLSIRGASPLYKSFFFDARLPVMGRSLDEMWGHPNSEQFRFGTGPSPHFSLPDGSRGVPTVGPFHVDKDAPGVPHILCVAGVKSYCN